MSSRRQRPMRQASTQPTPADRLADMTETDVIQAELAGLEQGLLQLRLQQQEADAALRQANDSIQQQIGAIATLQRVLQTLQGQAAERQKVQGQVPDPTATLAAEPVE